MKLWMTLVPFALLAQTETARVVDVRSMETTRLDAFLNTFGVRMTLDPSRRFAVLRGTPEQITAAEEAIKKVQVPSRNIEMTFQVLLGSQQAGTDKLPAELETMMKPVRASFPGLRLLDSVTMRVREGSKGDVSSLVPDEKTGRPGINNSFNPVGVGYGGKGTVIHMDELRIRMRYPHVIPETTPGHIPQVQFHESGLYTELDVRENQKVVAGD